MSMESKNLKLGYDEIHLFGQKLVKTLCDTLWHAGGHEVCQSSAIPSAFESFKGYNCPEKVKHRKRQHGNLSCDQLTPWPLS